MAVSSRHPVSAPPTAPVRETTGHLLLRAWCVFVIAASMAGTSWLMAFGTVVAAVVVVATGVVSTILWVTLRPRVQWRRLPWFALAYVAWAVASLLWSHWLAATELTLMLLVSTTLQAMFVAAVFTWREIVRAVASALKWMLALSILFELWVALIWRGDILPGFVRPDASFEGHPITLWSRDNLFNGGRLQGIFGNANPLAYIALLAIIVFLVRIASDAPRKFLLVLWTALAVFLFWRAASATAVVCAVAVVVVLVTILLMRTARRPGERTRFYVMYVVVAGLGAAILWLARDTIFGLLGRSPDLTGRQRIWDAVGERIAQHPVLGWGYSTPWVPSEPLFDGWIIDHGVSVMQAHNMWLDVALQLGGVGVLLIALALLAFVWRSWFFAVDRPRWDLVADRPYTALTLLPSLVATVLLVQGIAESAPLLNWGWLLIVMFAFKIKQAPLVGRGPSEQRLDGEQGDHLTEHSR
ncbi:O-antigen ligase family protein [Microbacterium oleivorans]|uniref:O-antigen ligase family protein n=1 Tax=Microbacterium oleivorans TaxID=273677 RepID=A0A7D5EYL8_9MICO|nr:O-antigen ligase family protein [Microbacterium oleivorans]QLD12570.1 O-antigen ligase family protein [Microbacterium oleivorans]